MTTVCMFWFLMVYAMFVAGIISGILDWILVRMRIGE